MSPKIVAVYVEWRHSVLQLRVAVVSCRCHRVSTFELWCPRRRCVFVFAVDCHPELPLLSWITVFCYPIVWDRTFALYFDRLCYRISSLLCGSCALEPTSRLNNSITITSYRHVFFAFPCFSCRFVLDLNVAVLLYSLAAATATPQSLVVLVLGARCFCFY